MGIFNTDSRLRNASKSSVVSAMTSIVNTLLAFVYRALFVQILSAEYLGINGLFTNILTVLSLSELGITTAITYRFYQPIKDGNVRRVGQLMNFIKRVYQIIAVTILILGIILIPFLDNLINKNSQLPSDINLVFVYVLFLIKTVATYTYVYRQTLLAADQRQYTLSVLQCIVNLIRYIGQIVVLIITLNFTDTLIVEIVLTVILNWGMGLYIKKIYKPIFDIKESIAKEEKKAIFHETEANMLHKIGNVVLNGTDSIVLSKFVGLLETGLYSNYLLVLNGLNTVVGQLLNGFSSAIGNALVSQDNESGIKTFKRLTYVNLTLASVTSVCLYALVNDFISIWLNKSMLLDSFTVLCICTQYFLEISRKVNTTYVNNSGQFVRDKPRPIIEATLNIVISIVLAKKIGIAGVFVGTIISHLFTVFWREPLIISRYVFECGLRDYWLMYIKFMVVTYINFVIVSMINIRVDNWIALICKAIMVLIYSCITVFVTFWGTEEEQYFLNLVKK